MTEKSLFYSLVSCSQVGHMGWKLEFDILETGVLIFVSETWRNW